MSKFKVGDKVILANPKASSGHLLAEGWIGYVLHPDDGTDDIPVQVGTTGSDLVYYYFDEDELELLSSSAGVTEEIESLRTSALDKQVSGNHYKDCGIQPIEYIHANVLNYFEGNAVKYITRHRKKNGKADIEKAIHYLELMIELEYPE